MATFEEAKATLEAYVDHLSQKLGGKIKVEEIRDDSNYFAGRVINTALASGLSETELKAVKRAFGRIKGGRYGGLMHNSEQALELLKFSVRQTNEEYVLAFPHAGRVEVSLNAQEYWGMNKKPLGDHYVSCDKLSIEQLDDLLEKSIPVSDIEEAMQLQQEYVEKILRSSDIARTSTIDKMIGILEAAGYDAKLNVTQDIIQFRSPAGTFRVSFKKKATAADIAKYARVLADAADKAS